VFRRLFTDARGRPQEVRRGSPGASVTPGGPRFGPLLALALCLAAAACGSRVDPEATLDAATKAYEAGDYQAALNFLKSLLSAEPASAEGRRLMGEIFLDLGDGAAAEVQFDKAESLGDTSAELAVLRMSAITAQGDTERAITEGTTALVEYGDAFSGAQRARILGLIGTAHLAADEIDEAKKKYALALKADPDSQTALTGNASVAVREGRIEDAIEIAKNVTAAHPDYAPAWALLGRAHGFEQDWEAAEVALSKAIDLKYLDFEERMERVVARLELDRVDAAREDVAWLRGNGFAFPMAEYANALIAMHEGESLAAREAFERVAADHPDYQRTACYLGLLNAGANRFEQALSNLDACRAKFPNAIYMQVAQALVWDAMGDHAAAVETLGPLADTDAELPAEVRRIVSQVQMRSGDAERAKENIARLVAMSGVEGGDFMRLGEAQIAAGDVDKARQSFASAKSALPDSDADEFEVKTLLREGYVDRARARVETLLADEPDAPRLVHLLGLVKVAQNDVDGAEAAFRRVLELDDGHTLARLNLARLLIERERGEAEGVDLVRSVLAVDPADPRALSIYVPWCIVSDRKDDARTALAAARDASGGTSPDVLFLEAKFAQFDDRPLDALEHVRRLIELKGATAEWLRFEAQVETQAGRLEAAATTLERVLELDPTLDDYMLAGLVNGNLDRYAAAIRMFDEALLLEPDSEYAALARIEALLKMGEVRQARQAYDRLVSDHTGGPQQAEYQDVRSVLLAAEGRYQQSAEAAVAAFRATPNRGRLLTAAAQLIGARRYDQAIGLLEGPGAAYDLGTEGRRLAAEAEFGRGNEAAAEKLFREIVEADPGDASALNNLAWMNRERDPAAALEYVQAALRIRPNDPQILDTFAELQYQAGDDREAMGTDRRILAIVNDPNVRMRLVEALLDTGRVDEASVELSAVDARTLGGTLEERYRRLRARVTEREAAL